MRSNANDTLPLVPGTAQEHAVAWLRRLIVEGELRPGDRVNQEDLAERIGVSVAPVREALRVLEQEGQVTYRPRRGYFVTELRIEDLEEIYELRALLEERLAREALGDLDDEAVERIQRAAADYVDAAEAGDVVAGLAANRRFHLAILEAPARPQTMRILRVLWERTEAYRALYYNSATERRRSIDAHDRILETIASGDADRLVEALTEHRERGLSVLTGLLRGSSVRGEAAADD